MINSTRGPRWHVYPKQIVVKKKLAKAAAFAVGLAKLVLLLTIVEPTESFADENRGPTDPTDRRLRPIGVYESQLADTIPENYRPVRKKSLLEWSRKTPETERYPGRALSATYNMEVLGNTLFSDDSSIVIGKPTVSKLDSVSVATDGLVDASRKNNDSAASDRSNLRCRLGKTNLLISPGGSTAAAEMQLITIDGNQLAVIENEDFSRGVSGDTDGDNVQQTQDSVLGLMERDTTTVNFGWSLPATYENGLQTFVLQIPPTVHTTLQITVPSTIRLSSPDVSLKMADTVEVQQSEASDRFPFQIIRAANARFLDDGSLLDSLTKWLKGVQSDQTIYRGVVRANLGFES